MGRAGVLRGGGSPPSAAGFGGGGGGQDGNPRGLARQTSLTGIWVFLVATTVLFVALTGVFAMRRGYGKDWVAIALPAAVWWNTGILLASSIALEAARRLLRRGRRIEFNWTWTLGTLLGAAFLAGQWQVWRELRAAGVRMESHPGASFFYILTATHAAHLLGGLAALLYVAFHALRLRLGPGKRTAVEVAAIFWHFLDALWLYVLALWWYLR